MTSSTAPEITLLNGMLGQDFSIALDRHRKYEIRLLDLKDCIFGKSLADLTIDEALSARALIEKHGLEVYSLSSSLCHGNVEEGEIAFRRSVEAEIKKIVAVAEVLRPKSVRLLSAWTSRRAEFADSIAYLDRYHPWIFDIYRACIDSLFHAGYDVFIENETGYNIFSTVIEIDRFFVRLDRSERVKFTWDIQNLWQMGTAPTLAVYEALRDLIGYLHFKGGKAGHTGELAWASSLEDASWPVTDIVRRAVSDATIPVFCLNPSHGKCESGYDAAAVVERDIHYLRQLIAKD